MKFNQNAKGVYNGYKFVSTNKEVLVFTTEGIKKASVKRESDFDFESLFWFALAEPEG